MSRKRAGQLVLSVDRGDPSLSGKESEKWIFGNFSKCREGEVCVCGREGVEWLGGGWGPRMRGSRL